MACTQKRYLNRNSTSIENGLHGNCSKGNGFLGRLPPFCMYSKSYKTKSLHWQRQVWQMDCLEHLFFLLRTKKIWLCFWSTINRHYRNSLWDLLADGPAFLLWHNSATQEATTARARTSQVGEWLTLCPLRVTARAVLAPMTTCGHCATGQISPCALLEQILFPLYHWWSPVNANHQGQGLIEECLEWKICTKVTEVHVDILAKIFFTKGNYYRILS